MTRAVRVPAKLAANNHGLFFGLLKRDGIPLPVTEFRFAPPRRWRMDYCWKAQFVGLEVDGAVWVAGRHTRGSGWIKDTEKLNAAAIAGYRMLRCTPKQLHDLQFIATIRKALFP